MKKYVIFDIDGTLSDASKRQHHMKKTPKDRKNFFAEIPNDAPIMPIVSLYNELCCSDNYRVVLFTGRPENYRESTEEWMEKHALFNRPIFFRKEGDKRPDAVIKKEYYDEITADGSEVDFVVEDRNSVVAMWRDIGVVCFHCFDGDF